MHPQPVVVTAKIFAPFQNFFLLLLQLILKRASRQTVAELEWNKFCPFSVSVEFEIRDVVNLLLYDHVRSSFM